MLKAQKKEFRMTKIMMTNGLSVMIDDENYSDLSKHNWTMVQRESAFYAITKVMDSLSGKYTTMYMHRAIMSTPSNLVTHHLNGNGLDNQKSNLEILTQKAHGKVHCFFH